MKTRLSRTRQRGAALVIGLILLMIITLLAVVGMNISNSELASATSEQLRLRAFQAAQTGIERGLFVLDTVPTTDIHIAKPEPVTNMEGSAVNPATGLPQDSYQITNTYRGCSSFSDGVTIGKFVSYHFTVVSTGRSARNALAVHTAGAYIINNGDCL